MSHRVAVQHAAEATDLLGQTICVSNRRRAAATLPSEGSSSAVSCSPSASHPKRTSRHEAASAAVSSDCSGAPCSVDDLVRMSAASPAIVRVVLLKFELAGRIERHGGGLVSLV